MPETATRGEFAPISSGRWFELRFSSSSRQGAQWKCTSSLHLIPCRGVVCASSDDTALSCYRFRSRIGDANGDDLVPSFSIFI